MHFYQLFLVFQALLRNPLLNDKMAEDLWKKEYDFAVAVARKAGAVR